MKIREYKEVTENFLKKFMEKNKISRGEIWEQHELKTLMEDYYISRKKQK